MKKQDTCQLALTFCVCSQCLMSRRVNLYCFQEQYEDSCRDYLLKTGTLDNDRQYHTVGIMQALLQGETENNMQEEAENNMQDLVQEEDNKCLVM